MRYYEQIVLFPFQLENDRFQADGNIMIRLDRSVSELENITAIPNLPLLLETCDDKDQGHASRLLQDIPGGSSAPTSSRTRPGSAGSFEISVSP